MSIAWLRNITLMWGSDSTGLGVGGSVNGGYRLGCENALIAAGIRKEFVGPLSDNSVGMTDPEHRCISGETAATAKGLIGAIIATYRPGIVVLGWGTNDIGTGVATATVLDDIDACIDAVQANAPWARIIQVSPVIPDAGDSYGYDAYLANYATVVAALPARCATQGVTFVDIGTPHKSADKLHPDDVGYAAMTALIYPAILAVTP